LVLTVAGTGVDRRLSGRSKANFATRREQRGIVFNALSDEVHISPSLLIYQFENDHVPRILFSHQW
jgi:hypothetical protein